MTKNVGPPDTTRRIRFTQQNRQKDHLILDKLRKSYTLPTQEASVDSSESTLWGRLSNIAIRRLSVIHSNSRCIYRMRADRRMLVGELFHGVSITAFRGVSCTISASLDSKIEAAISLFLCGGLDDGGWFYKISQSGTGATSFRFRPGNRYSCQQ